MYSYIRYVASGKNLLLDFIWSVNLIFNTLYFESYRNNQQDATV